MPVGIDGGLIGVVMLDLVLSWIRQPTGWLRQLVRALTVGTVAASAAAGWPDLVSAGLHAAAPLMLLAMVEAGRTVLLRRIGGLAGQARDPIPAARWLLAPWPTWVMWRRMVLWQAGGFRGALEAEQERRHAVALLRVRYGRRWQRQAPPELAWMLRSGATSGDVVARARALTGEADIDGGHATVGKVIEPDMPADARTVANGHAAGSDGGHRRTQRARLAVPAVNGSRVRRSAAVRADRADPVVMAARLLADHPDMTGADLGRELGVSPRHGLRLKNQAKSSGIAMTAS